MLESALSTVKFLSSSASTNDGNERTHNEDTFLCAPEIGLWLVADGMGGHDSGEVASEIARNYVQDAVKLGMSLRVAINNAHHEILNASKKGIGSEGMGTTIVALQFKDEEYELAWVGDSRAYLWDGQNGNIEQISHDHSYVQSMVDRGLLSESEARDHPQSNVITQALGYTDLDDVAVDRIQAPFYKNQKILLCSDGLSNDVTADQMSQIIAQGPDEKTIVDNLINLSLEQGGSDNVTAVVISAPENAPLKPESVVSQFQTKRFTTTTLSVFFKKNQQLIFILGGAILAAAVLGVIKYLIF